MEKYKNIIVQIIKENGNFPNNPRLPLLLYKQVLPIKENNLAQKFEEMFEKNHWGSCWRNGIYSYHHYHSTAHEVLGIYNGWANVQFGGSDGVIVKVEKGDAVVIPAGVSHKNQGASGDFACVGAYPSGQDYDMNYGRDGERLTTDTNIERVPMPLTDPISGKSDGLINYWSPI
jgi:uncharacterized protein YjlB